MGYPNKKYLSETNQKGIQSREQWTIFEPISEGFRANSCFSNPLKKLSYFFKIADICIAKRFFACISHP